MGCCTSSSGKQTETVVQEDKHVSGLSRKQRFLLKGSWKGISRELEKTTENLVEELLKSKDFQPSSSGLREDQIQLLTEQLMDRIDLIIFHLEDEDNILDILKNTALDLRSQYNLTTFSNIHESLLCTIERILDERYTTQMERIYKQFVQFIFDTMNKNLSQ